MKRKCKIHCLQALKVIVFLFLLTINANATHIVGGELNYRYLGGDVYEIHLTVYRDCYNGIPPLDNPAYVFVYDAFNNLVTTLSIDLDSSNVIPPTVNSPCFIPPTDVCYEHGFYHPLQVTLPASNAGYQLAYQRCCRNNTILNIVSPDSTGATFYAFIPGTNTFSQNSNPVFGALPPPFLCYGAPFVFDHSATDFEGDSIVYELCDPFNGASAGNPIPTPSNLPLPPPYIPIAWQPPFSITNVVSANPPFVIDPHTGIITGTPNLQGQYVVAVCAKEFRNGIFLSATRRDFQLNVVLCPTLVVAALQNPLVQCGNNTVQFQNFSFNATKYHWDFGVAGTLADTSDAFAPQFIYPDTGVYTIKLVAFFSDTSYCADTAYSTVHIYPAFNPTLSYARDSCYNIVSFTDTVIDSGSGIISNWLYQFGDGGVATVHNPVHAYPQGNYNAVITFTSSKGCVKTFTQPLSLPPLLSVTASIDPVHCNGECNGTATAIAQNGSTPYTYQWNDPLLQNTSIADSLCRGDYTVIVTDNRQCVDTLTVTVNEPDSLALTLSSTLAYCHGACIGSAFANPSGGNSGYTYLWNDQQQQTTQQANHLCPGIYSVTVTDSRNCHLTDSVTVVYSDTLPYVMATTDHDTLYHGQSAQLTAMPDTDYFYQWYPPTGLNADDIQSPISTPPSTLIYFVTVTDSNGCTNTDSVRIVILDVTCREPEIFIPNAFSPNNDQQNDVLLVRGNTMEKIHLALYDRWGEKLFETNDQHYGWDGTYKGAKVNPGVYVYYLEATCYDKQEFFKKGNVTLMK